MVGTEFTAKAVIIGIEVVLLVVFIVLLSSMTSSILKPDKEIVLANTAMLTNAFNEVCRQHRSKTIELDSINFPQPKPSKLMGASDILPRTYINMYGDPNFLLYYEAFPPVEGISWDVYNNELGFRTVAPYGKINEKVEYSGNAAMKYFEKMGIYGQYNDDSFVNTVLTDTMNRLERGKSGASELYAGEKFTVVVPNIMLNKHMMPNPVDGPKVQFMGTEATGFGKWEKEPVMGENNFFAFNSNFALSREEKSYIKYRPCGENTLCLKTREGIYTFPLTECDGKIDYIQLVYDYASVDGVVKKQALIDVAVGGSAAAVVTIGGVLVSTIGGAIAAGLGVVTVGAATVGKTTADVYNWAGAHKVSDFYLTSPCEINKNGKITITLDDCSATGTPNNKPEYDIYDCPVFSEHPIYHYTEEDGTSILTHDKGNNYAVCNTRSGVIMQLAKEEGKEPEAYLGDKPYSKELKCLRIVITKQKEDFCWTPNGLPFPQYMRDSSFFESPIFTTGDFKKILTKKMLEFGGSPILKATTTFIDKSKGIYAQFMIPADKMETDRRGMLNIDISDLKKRWNWGWPGGGLV